MSGSASALWLLPAVSLEPEAIDAHAGILRNRLLSIAGAHTDVRFASSMAAEDMVLVDAIATSGAPIAIFTIDTGRLQRFSTVQLGAGRKDEGGRDDHQQDDRPARQEQKAIADEPTGTPSHHMSASPRPH